MDRQHTEQLYERFPELYRERTAPLKSSGMAWGFQCGNGWYKIIYEMSQKIQKLSVGGEFAPAITQVSKHEDGTLHVEARNITPPIQDVITTARETSRLTCEECGYTPAFLRKGKGAEAGHIACGRCARKNTPTTTRKTNKRNRKPRRAPDVVVVKR